MKTAKRKEIEDAAQAYKKRFNFRNVAPIRIVEESFLAGVMHGIRLGFEAAREIQGPIRENKFGALIDDERYRKVEDFLKEVGDE